jgi:hypothetical protein
VPVIDDAAPTTSPDAVGPAGGGRSRTVVRHQRWQVGAAVALTLVALLPVIAVLVQRWGRVYVPVGDQATLDLRIRDVWTFSANTPLTGPWSRFGWNHPGPTMFYLLALFSKVNGEQAWASLVGNVLLQGLAVGWIARLSWKSGGLARMVPWLAVVTLSYWATGPWILQQLWNPYLPFPFFALLLLQAWLVGSGQARRLAGLVFVASFLVQTHVSYAIPALGVGGWALARLLVAEHRVGRSLRSWSLWRAPAVVLAVLWVVPLVVDTALHFPGNTVRLVKFYAGLDPDRHLQLLGLHGALGFMATEFRWRPPWLGGADPLNRFTALTSPSSVAWMVVPVALIGGSWWMARRRGRDDLRTLSELGAVSVVSGTLALTVLTGAPYEYLFFWRITIGAYVVVMSLVVLAETASAGRGWAVTLLSSALVVVTAVASISLTRAVAAADGPVTPTEPVAASILAQLRHEGQPRGKVLLRTYGAAVDGLHAAVLDQLVREGAPAYVDDGLGYQFGYDRTASPSQVSSVWYVIEESELYSLVTRIPGVVVLAVSHPLPADEQAELVALQRRMSDQLTAEGRSDDVGDLGSEYVSTALAEVPGIAPADLERLEVLNRRVVRHTCLCSVVAVRPDRLPPLLADQ